MTNKTPPAWAMQAARMLDKLWPDLKTDKAVAAIIVEHAPDAEALAVALEEFRRIAWEMKDGIEQYKAMRKHIETVDAALTTYRAAHPKVTP